MQTSKDIYKFKGWFTKKYFYTGNKIVERFLKKKKPKVLNDRKTIQI